MNDARRKELERARVLLDEARAIVEDCGNQEREYADAMPENMQSGDRYEKASAIADALEQMASELSDKVTELENVEDQ